MTSRPVVWKVEELQRRATLSNLPIRVTNEEIAELCDIILEQNKLLLGASAVVLRLPDSEWEKYDDPVYDSTEGEVPDVEELDISLRKWFGRD